jgi:hypothetical protein
MRRASYRGSHASRWLAGFLWVNAVRSELRSEWYPTPAGKTLAETGAPAWAVEAFERL